jgi:Bacillus/Clostridium GerA spore germination protein
LGNSADLVAHRFQAFSGQSECAVIYLKSFTDIEELNQTVLSNLIQLGTAPKDTPSLAKVLPQSGTQEMFSLEDISKAIAKGDVVLLVSGFKSVLGLPLKKVEKRAITEPDGEKVVRGPRSGFVESLWTNLGLLREKIKNPDLRLEIITLGTRTFSDVGILWIDGLANPKIVEEVKTRLKRINVDRILSMGEIGEFISDSPWSPFPTNQITERPDHHASALLDGRVGIMLDGTPVTAMVPVTFWEFFKSPSDYIENPHFASFIRIIRVFSLLITLLLPGAFIALTTIHLQMLPQTLAVIISGARTRTPMPTALEIFAMELTVEVLREAGLRMPGVFGQTISILGALVIGEAAVTAGVVGPLTVIIVALTTLASFVVPSYPAAISIRLLRFPLILLSAAMGFFGLSLGAMFLLVHLVSLRSFGVPFFSPLAPLFLNEMGDMLVRLPWWKQLRRPKHYRPMDEIREGPNQKPGPEKS